MSTAVKPLLMPIEVVGKGFRGGRDFHVVLKAVIEPHGPIAVILGIGVRLGVLSTLLRVILETVPIATLNGLLWVVNID